MLRLIIADDEKIIRESISNLINWNEYEIDLIGVCKDGIEAYNMIVDEYPDIVMTDIKMPGLDGLDLIKKANEIDPDIEFVILSGYSEFEFAKKAMEFGVKYYLLKPINENKIIEVMEKVRTNYYKKKSLNNLQNENNLLSIQFQSIIKKQFIIESLTCETKTKNLINQYTELFKFKHKLFALYYVSYLEDHNLPVFVDYVIKLCTSFHCCICFNILYVKNTAAIILNFDKGYNLIEIDESLESLKFPKMSVGLSCQHICFSELNELFYKLIPNLQRYNKIFMIEDDKSLEEIYNYAAFFKQVDEISNNLFNNSNLISENLDIFFSTINDMELAKTLASRLVVQTILNTSQQEPYNSMPFIKELYGCVSMPDIVKLTTNELAKLLTGKDNSSVQYKNYINQTLQYISKHYSDTNISLKWIAENYIFMNVNYLSKQFYKETGEKFSTYLNKLRMEQAKDLILEYGISKVSQIANQVGFGDNTQYFSQAFKKYFGCTPSDYIEKNHKS